MNESAASGTRTPTTHRAYRWTSSDGWSMRDELVTSEKAVTVYINGSEFATIVCSPWDLDYMVIGFLRSEGILRGESKPDVPVIDYEKGTVHVTVEGYEESLAGKVFLKRYINSCCGRSRASFYYSTDAMLCRTVTSTARIEARTAVLLMNTLMRKSDVFRQTGGVHVALLAQGDRVLAFHEDIGRNNVLDRIMGQCLLDGIDPDGKTVAFSGRISSEIVLKISKMRIPILIARSAPTDLALELADELGITIMGFTRGNRLNLYTHVERMEGLPDGIR